MTALPRAVPGPVVLAAALCVLLLAARALAGDIPPFCPGERLDYSLRWEAIPAGTASLEVLPPSEVDGARALHFRMTARTNPAVDLVYKVRDQVDAYAAPDLDRSLLYVKRQREGSYRRDVEVRFFWTNSTAQYGNDVNGPKAPILILPGTLDPLSVFFGFRSAEPDPKAPWRKPVTDGVKCVIGEARVVGRERVQVPAGSFDTLVVEPDLQHLGGVFRKSPEASVRIWMTDDERRMPVMVSSKVVVGRFYAVLTGFSAPACGPEPARAEVPSGERF